MEEYNWQYDASDYLDDGKTLRPFAEFQEAHRHMVKDKLAQVMKQ